MTSPIHIRAATEHDAPALRAIYAPFVERTTVSFELETPSVDDFAARIAKALRGYVWLVAEIDGQCAGYAYGSAHRERAAYRWSVETSAYVAPRYHRRGVGRTLYERLLRALADEGFGTAFAGIALPNDASMALHRAVGFEPIGVFHRVGWKFGAWQDVAWFERRLRDAPLAS